MTVPDDLAGDLHRFARAIRRMGQTPQRGALTVEQLGLLAHLNDDGPLRIGELAQTLGISQSATTTACQRLERAGLVTRTRVRHDERVVTVVLTDVGQECLADWRLRQPAQMAPLLEALTEQEAGELQRLVQKVLAAVGTRPHGNALVWSLLGCAESLF